MYKSATEKRHEQLVFSVWISKTVKIDIASTLAGNPPIRTKFMQSLCLFRVTSSWYCAVTGLLCHRKFYLSAIGR